MLDKLRESGVRLALDAEPLVQQGSDALLSELVSLNKPMLSKQDVLDAIERVSAMKVEVIRSRERPLAAEHPADIKILHHLDVTGKSRTTGSVGDFVAYFRNRYTRISRILQASPSQFTTSQLGDIKRDINQKVRVIAMISEKADTKNGNILLNIEDPTGSFKAVVSRKYENTFKKARNIMRDDIISISGKVLDPFIIVEDIEWPDLPVTRERKTSENDLACAYISDIHFGSRHFVEKYFERFTSWLNQKGPQKELAGKVKYLFVAGDVVDGIGIYPNQEKDLVIRDVYKQYELFDNFVEMLPDHIEVIVSPGNHDAVRRAEPMPALDESMIKSDVVRVGNPSWVSVEGFKHLIYHATSFDSMVSNIPGMSYSAPEKVMVEYLKRRHLSPVYGGNLIVPERIDYLVIEEEPDVFHCGHVHKNGYSFYRGTHVVNSGTFQDTTDFQLKQGHVPSPGIAGVLEMKTGTFKTMDFTQEGGVG